LIHYLKYNAQPTEILKCWLEKYRQLKHRLGCSKRRKENGMEQNEIIKILLEIHSQLAVVIDRVNSNRYILGLLFAGSAGAIGTIWGIFRRKFNTFRRTIEKQWEEYKEKSESASRAVNEQLEVIFDKIAMIDKCDEETSNLMHEIIESEKHQNEIIKIEFDNQQKICNERHRK
jgi:hypothetical protein